MEGAASGVPVSNDDDPTVYTKPWTVRHLQDSMPDGELIEFICEENNRFPPQ